MRISSSGSTSSWINDIALRRCPLLPVCLLLARRRPCLSSLTRNPENAVLIVCPNLAFDRTVSISSLRPGAVQRTGPASSVAGGKGANVARAALALGGRTRVLGFLPDLGGGYLRQLFSAEGVTLLGVEVGGAVRTCTALVEDSGRVSLLNEPGPDVTDQDWRRLLDGVDPAERTVIGTGSLPPGAPVDGYAELITLVHSSGGECAVDAGGPALLAAATAGADLLCPNLFEATSALSDGAGTEVVDHVEGVDGDEGVDGVSGVDDVDRVREPAGDIPERAMDAAVRLVARGAGRAAVTAGAAGVAFAEVRVCLWLPAVLVTARNPIGAGDSLLAGTALAREQGAGWMDAVRFGMATAASSVENDRAGVVDAARVAELAARLLAAHQIASA
jgi:fructose-1-phosphate kinase PfkB-like protein